MENDMSYEDEQLQMILLNELKEKQIMEERALKEEQDLEYQKSLEMDNNDNYNDNDNDNKNDNDKIVFEEISLEEMRKIRLKRFQNYKNY